MKNFTALAAEQIKADYFTSFTEASLSDFNKYKKSDDYKDLLRDEEQKLRKSYFNSKENLLQLIDNSGFSFFIFDYHMDVSKTINDLKEYKNNLISLLPFKYKEQFTDLKEIYSERNEIS